MLSYIKAKLKGHNIKVGYHAPMMSFVEGIFSRGDEKSGKLLFDAWKEGARFDAWEDHFDENLWKKVIDAQDWNVEEETCRQRELTEKLPLDNISLGISSKYLPAEWNNSLCGKLTPPCTTECNHNCGVCGKDTTVENAPEENSPTDIGDIYSFANENERYRIIFSFSKKGMQIFLGHLDVMRLFEKAFQRSMLNIRFTAGFNPKPKLEFANPLSLGIESENEIAAIETTAEYSSAIFVSKLNSVLPEGIQVKDAVCKKFITGDKIISLMSLYRGGVYFMAYNANGDSANYEQLLKNYVEKNNLANCVKIEQVEKEDELDSAVKNNISAAFGFDCMHKTFLQNSAQENINILKVTILVKPEIAGKSMLKILKAALENPNPLSKIYLLREKIFAGDNLENYLLFEPVPKS
jgi:radical SAM-linked protein